MITLLLSILQSQISGHTKDKTIDKLTGKLRQPAKLKPENYKCVTKLAIAILLGYKQQYQSTHALQRTPETFALLTQIVQLFRISIELTVANDTACETIQMHKKKASIVKSLIQIASEYGSGPLCSQAAYGVIEILGELTASDAFKERFFFVDTNDLFGVFYATARKNEEASGENAGI
jgi:N-acyl-D-aspartate/D-glutamate deacylase